MPGMPFHWPPIFKGGIALRTRHPLCEIFKQIDREVQIEIVHVSSDEVQLARKLVPQRGPVCLGIMSQIVAALPHILGDFAIDFSGPWIPERSRIAVVAHRTIDSFPRIELIAGPAL